MTKPSLARFTPGPWVLDDTALDHDTLIRCPDGEAIASVWDTHPDEGDPHQGSLMDWRTRIRKAHKLSDKELRERALGGCEACAAVGRLRSKVFKRRR